MLIIPQPKSRHRRVEPKLPPAPPAPVGLIITNVTISPVIATQLIVTFSGSIVWNGVDVPYEFHAVTEDGMDSVANVLGAGPDWLEVEFNSGVAPGAAWELVGPMAGISPDVMYPQSGMVTA